MNETSVLWSWGANSYGQLCRGDCEDQLVPTEVTNPGVVVKQIGGGGGHTLLITESNELWSCGSNNKGQLGLGHTQDVATLTKVTAMGADEDGVAMATGGWDFSLAVTGSGKLFCWGSNGFGQLGDPKLPDKCTTPTQVNVGDGGRVVKIAAGLRHSVALLESGEVYCWGHAKKGQCGNIGPAKPPLKLQAPVKVSLPASVGKVTSVVAGSYHTAVLTDAGQVLVWGCNKYGQCVEDPQTTPQCHEPHPVGRARFGGSRITALGSGWTHLIAQTESGDLYSWGRGDYGQLGRSRSSGQVCSPDAGKLATAEKLTHFACGSEHTLFLTESKRLASVGWNEHGLCGTGDEENVETVTMIETLRKRTVTRLGCGGGHCFAVTCDTDKVTLPDT